MKEKIKEIPYPEHEHPHGVENKPPNEYRIWRCEECGYIFSDEEARKGAEANWGHPCKDCKIGCESHLEPYIPDVESLIPQVDSNKGKKLREILRQPISGKELYLLKAIIALKKEYGIED
jgi:hypothetical protein